LNLVNQVVAAAEAIRLSGTSPGSAQQAGLVATVKIVLAQKILPSQ